MDSAQPPQQAQRILAAIVFTDVVGFSRISSQNEAEALMLVRRDHALMGEIITRHQGLILNTMGDGLLIRFDSAVEALRASIEMQQALHDQAKRLTPKEILKHRIGIHLGDVMVDGVNVMGDGVNVAARLQTIARPGGIAFSRTVHDVAKNKVRFNATYLGPRALKNIPQPVHVHEIPPLEESDAKKLMVESGLVMPSRAAEPSGVGKIVAFALGGVALIALLAAAITSLKPSAVANKPRPKVESASPTSGGETEKTVEAKPSTTRTGSGPSTSGTTTPAAPTPPPTPSELAGRLIPYLSERFATITRDSKFSAYVTTGSTGKILNTVYGGGAGLVVLEDMNNANPQPVAWSQLSPLQVTEIATEIAKQGAPPEFSTWLQAYKQLNHVP